MRECEPLAYKTSRLDPLAAQLLKLKLCRRSLNNLQKYNIPLVIQVPGRFAIRPLE